MPSRLLIVDDDPEMLEALGLFFSEEGYACEATADGTAALEIVDLQTFDAVICDVVMQGMSGLEVLDRLRRTHPALPCVVITGAGGGLAEAVDAIKRGAFDYVVKPFDGKELLKVVTAALEDRRNPPSESSQRAPSRGGVGPLQLVGSGPAMRAVQTAIDLVARSSAPVLVLGETGVGKELVARAIHARSARREQPFVTVNTSAIPQELLEAELFGHVRGGFTGASQARRGLLTEADGGTLLLDEIGDNVVRVAGQAAAGSPVRRCSPRGQRSDPPRRRSRDRVDAPRPAGAGRARALP